MTRATSAPPSDSSRKCSGASRFVCTSCRPLTAEFQSQFHWYVEGRDIRHVYIRPRMPQLDGKVERSHRVDDQECYQLLDRDGVTDDIHLFNDKLREWEDYYK